jgi:hypothetical protein
VVVEANRLHGSKGIWTPASRAGVMRDLLETMSPKARVDGKPVMPALEVHNKRQRPCTVHGKRSGTSLNIGAAARAAAGWHELERLDELRAVLPTGDDARRERNQERQRRRRVERAYRSMSPWKPSPTSQEAEEDGLTPTSSTEPTQVTSGPLEARDDPFRLTLILLGERLVGQDDPLLGHHHHQDAHQHEADGCRRAPPHDHREDAGGREGTDPDQ